MKDTFLNRFMAALGFVPTDYADDQVELAYDDGYVLGRTHGMAEGRSRGYEEGYEQGYGEAKYGELP